MKKKLLSLALAATMLIGASLSVSAADITTNDQTGTTVTGNVSATGEVQPITISVTVTTVSGGNAVILNPYQMAITNRSNATDSLIVDDITFKNNTGVPVAINLSGAVDLSGNTTIDVVTALTRPATPPTKNQVNVNVRYESGASGSSGAKMVTTATATKADDAVAYSKLSTSANPYTKLAKFPVLAKSGETDTPKDAKGAITNTYYSDTVVLKFGGWSMAKADTQWSAAEKINVITVYDIQTVDASKRSIFKTFNQ